MCLSPCNGSGVLTQKEFTTRQENKWYSQCAYSTCKEGRSGRPGYVNLPPSRPPFPVAEQRTLAQMRARPLSSKGAGGGQQVAQPDGSALNFSVALDFSYVKLVSWKVNFCCSSIQLLQLTIILPVCDQFWPTWSLWQDIWIISTFWQVRRIVLKIYHSLF